LASSQTQDEVRAEYAAKMGPQLGELQYLLWHDVTTLHLNWAEFRELFATKPSRIALMNETAPAFFGRLEDVLWKDVLLHLSRLTDKPAGRGKQRLTVLQYTPLVARLPIRDAVHAALDKVERAARFARDWRDRRIAHRDFKHAQDPAATPLEPASRAKIEAALKAVRELMQIPEDHFRDTLVSYEHVIGAPGGAWDMLYHLDSGLEAIRALRSEHIHWTPKYL
jgi:AbiU2